VECDPLLGVRLRAQNDSVDEPLAVLDAPDVGDVADDGGVLAVERDVARTFFGAPLRVFQWMPRRRGSFEGSAEWRMTYSPPTTL